MTSFGNSASPEASRRWPPLLSNGTANNYPIRGCNSLPQNGSRNAISKAKHASVSTNKRKFTERANDWKSACRKLLASILELEDSKPFQRYPDIDSPYQRGINQNMDLTKVKNYLEQDRYSTHQKFADDIRLIFKNWKSALNNNNKQSKVLTQANNLLIYFENEYSKMMKDFGSDNQGNTQKRLRLTPLSKATTRAVTVIPVTVFSASDSSDHTHHSSCTDHGYAVSSNISTLSSNALSSNKQLINGLPREKMKKIQDYVKQKNLPENLAEEVVRRLVNQHLTKKTSAGNESGAKTTDVNPAVTTSSMSSGLTSKSLSKGDISSATESGHSRSLSIDLTSHSRQVNPLHQRASTCATTTFTSQSSESLPVSNHATTVPSTSKETGLEKCETPKGSEDLEPGTGSITLRMNVSNIWFGACRTKPQGDILLSENGFKIVMSDGSEDSESVFCIYASEIVRVLAHFTKNKKHTLFLFVTPSCEKRIRQAAETQRLFNGRLKSTDSCTLLAIFIKSCTLAHIGVLMHIFHEMNKKSIYSPLFSEVDQKGALSVLANIKPQITNRLADKVKLPLDPSSSRNDEVVCQTVNEISTNVNDEVTTRENSNIEDQTSRHAQNLTGNSIVFPQNSVGGPRGMAQTDSVRLSVPGRNHSANTVSSSTSTPVSNPNTSGISKVMTMQYRLQSRMADNTSGQSPRRELLPNASPAVAATTITSTTTTTSTTNCTNITNSTCATTASLTSTGSNTCINSVCTSVSSPAARQQFNSSQSVMTARPTSVNNTLSNSLSVTGHLSSTSRPVYTSINGPQPGRNDPSGSYSNIFSTAGQITILNVAKSVRGPGDTELSVVSSIAKTASEDVPTPPVDNDIDLLIVDPSDSDDELTYLLAGQSTSDGDDFMVVRSSISTKCPITQTTMVYPVKNNYCAHRYDREGVQQLIRNRNNKARCPVPGCSNQKPLLMCDMTYDKELAKMIGSKAEKP